MSSNFVYIEPEDLIDIIDIIQEFEYDYKEEVPNYDQEIDGIDNYFALIDRSKQIYYPDIFSKASYLFININNHYFSNGNKRLAVVSTVYFLEKNKYSAREILKNDYKKILIELFGEVPLVDFKEFDAISFGLYNLAIIVAMRNESKILQLQNDDTKEKVEQFFKAIFVSP